MIRRVTEQHKLVLRHK